MDNQHRRISGYRELNQDEIDLMNEIKAKGIELGELYSKLYSYQLVCSKVGLSPGQSDDACRWLAIGKTHFQQGLMAWTRAVAKPEFF